MRCPLACFALAVAATASSAADWKPAKSPLMTRWGQAVTPENVWREYPRPQMMRTEWKNLNGLWDYAVTKGAERAPEKFDGQILVPFGIESALSGVGKTVAPDQTLWYRTKLSTPPSWAGKRILLHFGAVDWKSVVSVNGKELVTHKGGSDSFTVDITDALTDGTGELTVRVTDPTDSGSQPRGKQIHNPNGIWYTPVTGIWQTVWLEAVNKAGSIESVRTVTDIDAGTTTIHTTMAKGSAEMAATYQILDGLNVVAQGKLDAGKPTTVAVPNPKLWSPDSPSLYTLKISAQGTDLNAGTDEVTSYFAMRKIAVAPDDKGVPRMMLNNKPVFQFGPLDQGWWPDGLLTPPSDEALRYDIEYLKRIGFNMIRKHIKVEPARFYRHCDELGMLVWQDMPSGFKEGAKQTVVPDGKEDVKFAPADADQFKLELKRMIDHLRGFACIVVWVPFNEGWGQHDTNEILKWTKEYDPTRLVNGPSGWQDRGVGDMIDAHIYPGPGMPPTQKDRAMVLGEYGGLGLPVEGHTWQGKDNWGYRTFTDKESLGAAYKQLTARLHPLIGKGLSAAVYTQTTDVEVEVNGYLTYDRAVEKIDAGKLREWHDALKGPPPVSSELVPTSEKDVQTWSYRFDKPADGWEKSVADADGWKSGPGGFGTKITPNSKVGTEWKTPDVWVRREFTLKELPTGDVLLRMFHDEDAEVFLNGVLAVKVDRWSTNYEDMGIQPAALKALKPGKNVIAVHCKQTSGGQFLDAGLVEMKPAAAK